MIIKDNSFGTIKIALLKGEKGEKGEGVYNDSQIKAELSNEILERKRADASLQTSVDAQIEALLTEANLQGGRTILFDGSATSGTAKTLSSDLSNYDRVVIFLGGLQAVPQQVSPLLSLSLWGLMHCLKTFPWAVALGMRSLNWRMLMRLSRSRRSHTSTGRMETLILWQSVMMNTLSLIWIWMLTPSL